MKKFLFILLGLMASFTFAQSVAFTNMAEQSFGETFYTPGVKVSYDVYSVSGQQVFNLTTEQATTTRVIADANFWPLYSSLTFSTTKSDWGDYSDLTLFSSYNLATEMGFTFDVNFTGIWNFDQDFTYKGNDESYFALGFTATYGW